MADDHVEGLVRITNQMMYAKLLELSENQIEILVEMRQLKDVPDRLHHVELEQARVAWIEKIALAGLGSGIIAIGTSLFNMIVSK